tara:strand:+ start:30359 stop:30997 length:639 start_codon:yes stop_codon:yes gene_type:complete
MTGKQKKNVDPLAVPGRRSPKQERSKETVRLIMEATIDLLEEGGFVGLTMQKIADKAGINVAAVYSYFPNKHQVLAELYERQFGVLYESQIEYYRKMVADKRHWVDIFVESLGDLAKNRMNQRGSAALRKALHASPTLWDLNQKTVQAAARQFVPMLERIEPDYEGDQSIRGRIVVEAITTIFDLMQTDENEDPEVLFNELVKMIDGYLKNP